MRARAYTPHIVVAVIVFLASACAIFLVEKLRVTNDQEKSFVSVVSLNNPATRGNVIKKQTANASTDTNRTANIDNYNQRLYDVEQDIRKNIFPYSLGESNPKIVCRIGSCIVSTDPTTEGLGMKATASVIMLASGNYNDKLAVLGFEPILFDIKEKQMLGQNISVTLIKK